MFLELRDCLGVLADDGVEGECEVLHLIFFEDHVPAVGLHPVEAHVGGFVHHGRDELVGLVILKEDKQKGSNMTYVSIVEQLTLLLLEEIHQLLQHRHTLLIQKRTMHGFLQLWLLRPKHRHRLAIIDILLEFVIVGLEIIEILIEDDTDDGLKVLNRHPPTYPHHYLLIAYFHLVDTTSS